MQPRAKQIEEVLRGYTRAKDQVDRATFERSELTLLIEGNLDAPLSAQLREFRSGCAMIDLGNSIFTLAYADILGLDPERAGGGLRVTVRAGCLASHITRPRRSPTRYPSRSLPRRPEPAPASPVEFDSEEGRPAVRDPHS